ncbi:MAG: glycosyltransferase, partial [Rubripirellula sp.]
LNLGLELASTDWIARADADDINEPWRFERQLDYLRSNPTVCVLGSALEIIDSEGQIVGMRSYPTEHARIERTMHRKNAIAHPTVLFRKDAVLSVGGYQNPGQPAQDYDLWSRMMQKRFVFANLIEPTVRYRIHDSSTKSLKLKATIRSTLQIKAAYWKPTMNFQDRVRMTLEGLLLWVPSPWVSALFQRIEYQNVRKRRDRPTQRSGEHN